MLRTPKQEEDEPQMPPVPRHTSLRLRRPRLDMSSRSQSSQGRLHTPNERQSSLTPRAGDARVRVRSPRSIPEPQTPQAQIRHASQAPNDALTSITDARSSVTSSAVRPTSVRSHASDSSATSIPSTHISISGGCSTPESEIQDPYSFVAYPFHDRKDYLETPTKPPERRSLSGTGVATGSAVPHTRVVKWTKDMDNHLWNTYNNFLQDPTITPFKMLPGTLPPLGVSYRVAREARKTWAKFKPQWGAIARHRIRLNPRDGNRSNEGTATGTGSGTGAGTTYAGAANDDGLTPVGPIIPVKPAWPKSDASTRRRLKELCKRKFSIAPHYQRLIRSPSPKPESGGGGGDVTMTSETGLETDMLKPGSCYTTEIPSSSPFGTRDLGVSLVGSTCSVPQEPVRPPVGPTGELVSENWFNELNIPPPAPSTSQSDFPAAGSFKRPNGHSRKSSLSTAKEVPRLGSPFIYNTVSGQGPEVAGISAATQRLHGHRRRPSAARSDYFGSIQNDGANVPSSTFSESYRYQKGRWNTPRNRWEPKVEGSRQAPATTASDSQLRLKQLFTPPSVPRSGPAHLGEIVVDATPFGSLQPVDSSSPPPIRIADSFSGEPSFAPPLPQRKEAQPLGSPFRLRDGDTDGTNLYFQRTPAAATQNHEGSSSTVKGRSPRDFNLENG